MFLEINRIKRNFISINTLLKVESITVYEVYEDKETLFESWILQNDL